MSLEDQIRDLQIRLSNINSQLKVQESLGGFNAYQQCNCGFGCSGRSSNANWGASNDYANCKAIQATRPGLIESKNNIQTQIQTLQNQLQVVSNEQTPMVQTQNTTNNNQNNTLRNILLVAGALVLLS